MKKAIKKIICYLLAMTFCLTAITAIHISAEEQGDTKESAQVIETEKEVENLTSRE